MNYCVFFKTIHWKNSRFYNKFTTSCIGKQTELKDIMKKKWNSKKFKYRPENKKVFKTKKRIYKK